MTSSKQSELFPVAQDRGVYAIKNLKDGKVYVGSTSQGFRKRFGEHRKRLRAGTHKNRHLQEAWARDGAESFAFSVLEVVTDMDSLLSVEAAWMARTQCWDNNRGYNFRKEPHSNRGIKLGPQSPETIARRSAAMTGRIVSEETRAKLRARPPRRGFKPSEEQKRAISLALKGRRPHAYSEEWRAKNSASHKGLKMPPRSPEHSARISEALRRRGGTAKALTETQAMELREAYAAGGATHRSLAEQYGVSRGTIASYLRRS